MRLQPARRRCLPRRDRRRRRRGDAQPLRRGRHPRELGPLPAQRDHRRAPPTAGGRAVPGGRLLWADADTPGAVDRARELCRTVAVRLVVESAGAADPDERRLHLYVLADRWLDPDELEAANAALAARLGSDRVGDRGRLMRLPGTRNLKSGRPGRWCRVIAADLHAPASTCAASSASARCARGRDRP